MSAADNGSCDISAFCRYNPVRGAEGSASIGAAGKRSEIGQGKSHRAGGCYQGQHLPDQRTENSEMIQAAALWVAAELFIV